METWRPGAPPPGEEGHGYLECGAARLALAHHLPRGVPRATVVLAGPMGLERSLAQLTWVRWARVLAANGYEVFRFDYRGVGESTGSFAQATFEQWREDLAAVVAHARGPRPLFLHGLRLGALLGGGLLDEGVVDGFLAWDPPVGGRPLLLEVLRRKLTGDYAELAGPRRTREDYLARLEQGESLDVEGYPWSAALWRSAEPWSFAPPKRDERWLITYLDGRPVASLADPARYASVKILRPFWLQSPHLVIDLDELFSLAVQRLHQWSAEPVAAPAPGPSRPRARLAAAVEAGALERRLEVLDLPGGRCVGTHHAPAQPRSRVGLLWFNGGFHPRDGHGGLATVVCDAMARQGIPSFRFDLPGLGDAPGPLRPTADTFGAWLSQGAFVAVAGELVEAVCRRHRLEGVVLAGLCGGAVNAIFAGDALGEKVKGLLLLEPEMYVTAPKKGGEEATRPAGAKGWLGAKLSTRRLAEVLFSYWGWMRLLTQENKYARFIPLPRRLILDLVLRGSQLPSATNLELASAWRRWVKARRPALVITAKGKLHEVFFDRINQGVLRDAPPGAFAHVRLEGTNHIFTTGGAIERARCHIEDAWAMFGRTG